MSAMSGGMSYEQTRDLVLLERAGIVSDGPSAPLLRWRSTGDQYASAHLVNGTAEIGLDEVVVRFEVRPSGTIDFVQLAISAVAGCFLVTRCAVGDELVADLGRRVIAASERWAALPGSRDGIVVESASGRPWFELDVRDLPALRPGSGAAWTLQIVIRRQPPFAESAERLTAELRRMDDSLKGLGTRMMQGALGHDDALRRQFQALDGIARANEARDGALSARARDDHAAMVAAIISAFDHRFDAVDMQLEALKLQTTSMLESGFTRLSDQVAALAAARESDYARSSVALVAMQADIAHARHAIENVFWRRWLRRLTVSQGS